MIWTRQIFVNTIDLQSGNSKLCPAAACFCGLGRAQRHLGRAQVEAFTVGGDFVSYEADPRARRPYQRPMGARDLSAPGTAYSAWEVLVPEMLQRNRATSRFHSFTIQLCCQVTNAHGMCYGTKHTHTRTHTSHKNKQL